MFRGSHITGPTHNYLGMRIGRENHAGFDVVVLPAVGACRHHAGLVADEVKGWIAAGVERANRELTAHYAVEYAEVVENDSHRPEVYEELARRIVLARHADAAE